MIKAILAMDSKGGIGKNGSLPWPFNKEDMKHFQTKTTNHIVVMGSNTWLDPKFPSPLKNRENYVVSRTRTFENAIMLRANFKERLIWLNENTDKDIWIIGGANLLKQCFDIVEELDVSKIEGDYDCDTFITIPDNFKFVGEFMKKTESGTNQFITYKRT